ncbi:hypothetical protein FZEAL_3502 [Fusarium zealandicum]|uniref:Apple domain-containing protein n=1 Tax=Fusarium zealandicum TaxID=1053134 RepID=A0A8H4XME1_9HYPO|nr:hypothetical protein FZEAL_3502 [Fusarium zealandicum]
MVAFKSLVLLLSLGVEALAADPSIVCATALGTKSIAKPPRSTITVTRKLTIIKKITRKVNVIIIPVAKTTTKTETTVVSHTVVAGPNTKTAIEFSTVTSHTDITTTKTYSTTITDRITTTKSSTSTVPAPAGFTNVLEEPHYIPKRDIGGISKRGSTRPMPSMLGLGAPKEFPQRIDCTKRISQYSTKTITTQVQGPKITMKAVTKTKTITIIQHDTSTSYLPDLSTTITKTTTETETNYEETPYTTTFTETITVETQIPSVIEYAACGPKNLLVTANDGQVINGIDAQAVDYKFIFPGYGFNPTTCCNECMQRPDCQGSYFLVSANICYLIVLKSGTYRCPNGMQFVFGIYETTPGNRPERTWSNGPCGQIVNNGPLTVDG